MTDVASLKIKIDSTDVKSGTKDVDELGRSSKTTESSIAGMTAATAAAGAVLAGTFAVIKNSVKAATEYQNALNGLASVARYSGADVAETLTSATQITTDGLLSTTEAATALKNLLARGFSTDEAVSMIERFKDSAAFGRQSSLEFGQAVVSATEGIKNENSVLVDNAGVTKNVSVMHKEYAAQLNKSVNDLTMAEKRQAEYTGVMKETEAQLGNSALAAQGMDGASAKLSKTINDSAVTIGQTFMPAAIAVTNLIGDGFKGAMDVGVRPMLFMFESLGISAGELAMKVGTAFEFISSPSKWGKGGLEALDKQFEEYERIAEDMKTAAAARISGISGVMATLGRDTGKRRIEEVAKPKEDKKKERDDLRASEKAAREYAQALDEANRILANIDPQVKANQEWEKLLTLQSKLGDQFPLTAEQMGMAYAESMGKMEVTTKETFDEMDEFAKQAGRNMQDSFADFLFDPMKDGFDGMLQNFGKMLQRMAAEAAAAKILGSFGAWGKTGGGAGTGLGGIAAALFSGGMAEGGSVSTDKSYMVGERGPEIFTPTSNGEIIPNNKMNNVSKNSITINDNTVINIDSRSDRMQVLNDVSKMIESGNSRLVDRLQRQGQLA